MDLENVTKAGSVRLSVVEGFDGELFRQIDNYRQDMLDATADLQRRVALTREFGRLLTRDVLAHGRSIVESIDVRNQNPLFPPLFLTFLENRGWISPTDADPCECGGAGAPCPRCNTGEPPALPTWWRCVVGPGDETARREPKAVIPPCYRSAPSVRTPRCMAAEDLTTTTEERHMKDLERCPHCGFPVAREDVTCPKCGKGISTPVGATTPLRHLTTSQQVSRLVWIACLLASAMAGLSGASSIAAAGSAPQQAAAPRWPASTRSSRTFAWSLPRDRQHGSLSGPSIA